MNKEVTKAVYDKCREIQYNEASINTPNGVQKFQFKGKINCPILNAKIRSVICYKVMDYPGWPRNIDPKICECQAGCFINKSISKYMNKGDTDDTKK